MNAHEICRDRVALHRGLRLESPTEIVDIGANPIDGDPPYKRLLDDGLCKVTGFEPQQSALATLLERKSKHEKYLPYAIGDGNTHLFRLYRYKGLSSLLELDPASLDVFRCFQEGGTLVKEEPVETRRLDDVVEIERVDFLKIDTQGSELPIFQNGWGKLSRAVVIQTEVSFVPLYKGQPCIGEIDLELRTHGFIPHCAPAGRMTTRPIAPILMESNKWQGLNQLLETDLVYVRDFRHADDFTTEMLKHLALIASACYGSVDLTHRCLNVLVERGAIDRDMPSAYLQGKLPAK